MSDIEDVVCTVQVKTVVGLDKDGEKVVLEGLSSRWLVERS